MLLSFYVLLLSLMVGLFFLAHVIELLCQFEIPLVSVFFPSLFPSFFPSGRFLAPLIGAWFAPDFPF